MIRKLLTSSLLGLLISSGAQAGGFIPGSDTFVRSQDTAQSQAVASGTYGAANPSARESRTFGYPLNDGREPIRPGADRFDAAPSTTRFEDDASAPRGTRSIAPSVSGRTVPGSDSF